RFRDKPFSRFRRKRLWVARDNKGRLSRMESSEMVRRQEAVFFLELSDSRRVSQFNNSNVDALEQWTVDRRRSERDYFGAPRIQWNANGVDVDVALEYVGGCGDEVPTTDGEKRTCAKEPGPMFYFEHK